MKLEYNEIKNHYSKNDLILSLSDGKIYKYSGFLTLCKDGYDSFNRNLMVYKNGKLATVIEKGIDNEYIAQMRHIKNVKNTCKNLKCTTQQLLNMDYVNLL